MKSYHRFIFIFSWLCFLSGSQGTAQRQIYQTRSLSPDIQTIQVNVLDNWLSPPIIELNSNRQIEISFDQLSHEAKYLSYSLVHCNADWTPSGLSDLEYIDGFNTNPVENAELSFNTYMNYTHYRVQLPNDMVSFKVSGNYVLKVFPENEPEKPILYACFSVYEKQVNVTSGVTSRTDIDYNKSHQQVNFSIFNPDYYIRNPQTDLKIYVTQNNRRDNEVMVNTPLYQRANELVFEHNRDLIFEAGNEYRRFEMTDTKYAGLGVERIRYFNPFYHVTLIPDKPRANGNYLYDQTQFGRFLIRESNATNSEIEADYFVVHFTLDYDNPLIAGGIYINGELTHDQFNDNCKMIYNFETQRYEKEMLLKQGSYNFLYLFIPQGERRGQTGLIEGNYYETNNEYLIRVYHSQPGSRYDRLIGFDRCISGK